MVPDLYICPKKEIIIEIISSHKVNLGLLRLREIFFQEIESLSVGIYMKYFLRPHIKLILL